MPHRLPTPVDPQLFAQLESDLIFPEQFFPQQEPTWSGERSLLWAVFMDGVESFRKEVLVGNTTSEVYAETIAWIDEKGSDSIFCFENLCEIFGYSPGWVRRALYGWRERHLGSFASKAA